MKGKVRGLESVMAQLRSVGVELGAQALAGAARASFKRVQDTAKELVPKDSGDLAEAIAIRVVKPKAGANVVSVGLVVLAKTGRGKQATVAAAAFGEAQSKRLPPARRWHFIELGTSHSAPKPYMRPALDRNASAVVDDLAGQLRKKLDVAIKKGKK